MEPAAIGIDVEIDALAARAGLDGGQRSALRPKFSGIEHLWWLITTGTIAARPMFSVSSMEAAPRSPRRAYG